MEIFPKNHQNFFYVLQKLAVGSGSGSGSSRIRILLTLLDPDLDLLLSKCWIRIRMSI